MLLLSVIIEYFTHDEIKNYYGQLNPVIESYLQSNEPSLKRLSIETVNKLSLAPKAVTVLSKYNQLIPLVLNALDLAQTIAGCKFFIGNQSFSFAVAEAIKVKRVLEVCYETPNVIKLEGEHSGIVDRLNNQIIDIHDKNIRLRGKNEDLKKQKDRNDKLEASLCALITELEKRDIANEVISQASRSGLIDLMGFWEEHKQEDETKLANKIHTMFSEHEQEVIKKLLNKNKNKKSDEKL